MPDYEFTLTFALPDPEAEPEQYLEELEAAGCDDALIGVGRRGRIALDFCRAAPSAMAAVVSAMHAVRRAIPGARLVEANPDFVGLTDVADLIGFSRQNMRKLMLGSGTAFPLAVHEGSPAVWHLAKVLAWFRAHRSQPIDDALLEVAQVTMQLNIAKELSDLPRGRLPK